MFWKFSNRGSWRVVRLQTMIDRLYLHDPKVETWSHSFISVYACLSVHLSVHLPEVTCICRHRKDRHTDQPVLMGQHPSRTISCDMLFPHAQCEMFFKCFSSTSTVPRPTNQISQLYEYLHLCNFKSTSSSLLNLKDKWISKAVHSSLRSSRIWKQKCCMLTHLRLSWWQIEICCVKNMQTMCRM